MMTYTTNSHITQVEEVRDFFNYLVNERNCNFHPDDDFSEYVFTADGSPMFTADEITHFNLLMDECFAVCDKSHADIYGIGLEVLKKRLS